MNLKYFCCYASQVADMKAGFDIFIRKFHSFFCYLTFFLRLSNLKFNIFHNFNIDDSFDDTNIEWLYNYRVDEIEIRKFEISFFDTLWCKLFFLPEIAVMAIVRTMNLSSFLIFFCILMLFAFYLIVLIFYHLSLHSRHINCFTNT